MSSATRSGDQSRGQAKGQEDGQWLSLMDYAMKKELSLSTLRRYIKSNKVTFKLENGRYFLWDDESALAPVLAPALSKQEDSVGLQDNLRSTHRDLQKAKEEIAELKTLIAYYEERLPKGLDH